jgi:hypothetical protein
MDHAQEQEHLRKADADIAGARERIERQRTLIARMEENGHNVTTAKALLQTMRETLAVMEEHRQTILDELSR